MAKYNMTFEEAQEYISKRGFDIAWNDCDVFIDVRHITQAIGNILKWADEHPKEEPVSEDLRKAARKYARERVADPDFPVYNDEYEVTCAFEDGAKWKEEQFEKNRLKHCNSITNEQAELEQKFLDEHLDKHNRMPTFLDAIEYGMRLQKEQMMAKAIDTEVCERITQNGLLPSISILANDCEPNQKVKVIVIKEE